MWPPPPVNTRSPSGAYATAPSWYLWPLSEPGRFLSEWASKNIAVFIPRHTSSAVGEAARAHVRSRRATRFTASHVGPT